MTSPEPTPAPLRAATEPRASLRRAAGLVAQKELLEILRDRRSLVVLLLLPILLYPVLLLGMGLLATAQLRKLAARSQVVWVEDLTRLPPGLAAELSRVDSAASGRTPLRLELVDLPPGEDPDAALAGRRVSAVIRGPASAEAALARGEAAEVELLYHSGIDTSELVCARLAEAVRRWSGGVARERLAEAGLPESTLAPVRGVARDRGPPGAALARILAALLVVLSLTGAFYPALDVGAGEKERGTLETLLLAPVPRVAVALGKLLAVATVAATSTALHLASLGLTFASLSRFAPPSAESLAIGPLTLLSALLVLLPLVILTSALSLALSSFAASYKEGNAYLTPLLLVFSCAPLAAALPGVRLDAPTCLVPAVSAALLLREMLAGTSSAWQVLLVVSSSLVWALLAIHWAASLYDQEEVLLRPAAAAGPDLFGLRSRRAAAPSQGRVPTLPQSLLLGGLVLGLLALVGPDFQSRHLMGGIIATFVFLVLLPAVSYARLLGCDPRATFALHPPRATALLAAAVLSGGLLLLAPDLQALQEQLTGPMTLEEQRALARQSRELEGLGPVGALLLLALLPAVCEELVFRGFVLQGLLRASGRGAALLGSAFLFALAHLDPGRLLYTFAAGLLLGGLVIRGGSALPAVLLHAATNAGAILGLRPADPGALHRGGGLLALALGLALLLGTRPKEAGR